MKAIIRLREQHIALEAALREPKTFWSTTLILIALGVIIRLTWAMTQTFTIGQGGEAEAVAIALATKHQFADAFFPGQGPTAHLTPVTPAIAGLVLWLFGVGTPLANALLTVWALSQVFLSCILLSILFRRTNAHNTGIILSIAVFCLVPIFIGNDVFIFRYWDAALSVNFSILCLIQFSRFENEQRIEWSSIAITAILIAFTFFVTPTIGVGICLSAIIFSLKNLSIKQTIFAGVFAAIVLAAFVVPWSIRNSKVMGQPVLVRDNAGLQLALAYYPGAVSPSDPYQAYEKRLTQIHPRFNRDLVKVMRSAGGEVKYNKLLKSQTEKWISNNKLKSFKITMRHITEYFIPRPWQFRHTGSGKYALERSIALSIIELFGLFGSLIIFIKTAKYVYLYFFVTIIFTGLTYSVFQPLPRYTYLTYGIALFAAFEFVISTAKAALQSGTAGQQI